MSLKHLLGSLNVRHSVWFIANEIVLMSCASLVVHVKVLSRTLLSEMRVPASIDFRHSGCVYSIAILCYCCELGARENTWHCELVWAAQEMPNQLVKKLKTFEPKRLQRVAFGWTCLLQQQSR